MALDVDLTPPWAVILHGDELAHLTTVPARAARTEPLPDAVHPAVRDALTRAGIEQLYTHQAQAVEHALAGRHVVITTPTASGKTLCYNAPVLSRILRDRVGHDFAGYKNKTFFRRVRRRLQVLRLPGLDTDLDEASWDLIGGSKDVLGFVEASASNHPQYALHALLERSFGGRGGGLGRGLHGGRHGRRVYTAHGAVQPETAQFASTSS